MLVEAGPEIVQQLARIDLHPPDIERLFVSHAHGDHVLGFPMLVLGRLTTDSRLQVYAGPNTISTLQMLWTLSYADFDSHYLKSDWHRLSERGTAETELSPGVTLRTVVVPHPPGVQTLAARWSFADGPSFTFATDTTPNDATVELARGCDLLIHEASCSATLQPDANPSVHFHSTAQQAGEIARQAECPRLVLVHLGPTVGDHPDVLVEEARASTDLEVIVPEDGESIDLP
jgi:ribonuclease Z